MRTDLDYLPLHAAAQFPSVLAQRLAIYLRHFCAGIKYEQGLPVVGARHL